MLLTLILVAAVANLNLSVANVAPSIGKEFDASQTQLNLVAVGYFARASVVGVVAGRARRPIRPQDDARAGDCAGDPGITAAAYSPAVEVLVLARIAGGLAAGMAFPTTLALITALWSGAPRTRSIALWSGLGAAIAALGRWRSGFMLEHFYWGSCS